MVRQNRLLSHYKGKYNPLIGNQKHLIDYTRYKCNFFDNYFVFVNRQKKPLSI